MSVVIGLVHEDYRVAMLAGDIDEVGLSSLMEEDRDLRADILIFPHHGGRPGPADSGKFAYLLCSLIQPKVILFSFDRNRFNNPREEVIQGVKTASPNTYILCTQLSKRCATQLPDSSFDHLSNLPS